MDDRYKLIVSNKDIYKEYEISPEAEQVKVGTDKDCAVRLRKDLFFEHFELSFQKSDGVWMLVCSENVYLTIGDDRKLITKELKHADELTVKYQSSDVDAIHLGFMLDFDYFEKNYDREIDISVVSRVRLGGAQGCEVRFTDRFLGSDTMTLEQANGQWFLTDNNSTYGVYVNGSKISNRIALSSYDFFSITGFGFYLRGQRLYCAADDSIQINGLNYRNVYEHSTCFPYPKFSRSTRIQYVIPNETIDIQQPETKPQKPKKNILMSLIPSLVMLAMTVLLRGVMGGGGGGSFVIYSAVSMGLGIAMSVISFIKEGKDYEVDVKKRNARYNAYATDKRRNIKAMRENELRVRNVVYESIVNSIDEVWRFGRRLFEKSPKDEDFLDVYIGTGSVVASCEVKFSKQEFVDTDDPASLIPEQITNETRYIENAPIISRFGHSNGVGVVGQRQALHGMLRNMVLDVSIRHFYKEVKLFFILGEDDTAHFSWVRWLRHVYNEQIDVRNIVCDDESKNILLDFLYSELSKRESQQQESGGAGANSNFVVFILDSAGISTHPVTKYFEKSADYGFTFVFFEEREEMLPRGCTEIIRADVTEGVILPSKDADAQMTFRYSAVDTQTAEAVALKLGDVVVDEASLESSLTKNVSLFELLDIGVIEDLNLEKRWLESEVYQSMASPLGLDVKGGQVFLDISDKASAHGPHGLVAGTTGSGKSEILQSYVLSTASLFHPYDVGFVIIDFKGGGMANQFKDLPHLIGTITNIDGREINRSLLSIKAELVKRQERFSAAGVNHINDYIKLYKKGEVTTPLPHLIMIVDEFAELKAEYPDFMKEIISAARIGRTLGVHLILATQKPAGVVDNQIWSNSKFKLCLKVQTREDSLEVIKTPLAAEIVEPGRAYFQVGNNEIFELFQSAYSGAKVFADGELNKNVYDIYALNTWGKKTLIYTNRKKNSVDDAKSQLQVMVDYIGGYCETAGIQRLAGICLPSLPDVINRNMLTTLDRKGIEDGVVVSVGIFDDPEQQRQDNMVLNLSESNTYIIGSAQTGKTTFLQTLILQILENYSPAEANIYIIDCGNMALKVFEGANHVGGVALPAEEERVANLFKLLYRQTEERKNKFAEKGLGTYSAYIEAGFSDIPQTFLIIDNYAAFREYYENLIDDILVLSREGNSVGINLILAASQTNALSYKALSNFGTRIALSCNDSGEYSNLFDRCRMEPKEVPGRGLCIVDRRIVEFQTVLCAEGAKEIERVENMRRQISTASDKYPDLHAPKIPEVPAVLTNNQVKQDFPELYTVPYSIPVALDYATVEYRAIDLLTVGVLAISGREKSGKTNFIGQLLRCIDDNIFDNLTEAYVIDNANMQLEFSKEFGFVDTYTVDASDAESIITGIHSQLQSRSERVLENRDKSPNETLAEDPLLLLIVENTKFFDLMSKEKELYATYSEIIKEFKNLKVAVIFSNVENSTISFSAPDILKQIKDNKKFMMFEDVANFKIIDASVRQQKDNVKPITVGDAFWCFGSEISKVKTIKQ